MMKYTFDPKINMTPEQIVDLLKALQIRVDDVIFDRFPKGVQEVFRPLTKEELQQLYPKRKVD